MKNNIIKQKSFSFSLRIIKLYKYLISIKKEYVLSKQILRSGTSIGANIEEAIGGQSRKDFINKFSIAYKEARETHYWLELLFASDFIDNKSYKSIIFDCEEILKIITKIQKTNKRQLKHKISNY